MTTYYIKLKKKWVSPKGKIYNDNCGFCVKDIDFNFIKRFFDNKDLIIEEILIRARTHKRPIYKGNNCEECIKTLSNYLEGRNTNEK